jgi:hypothetical protein
VIKIFTKKLIATILSGVVVVGVTCAPSQQVYAAAAAKQLQVVKAPLSFVFDGRQLAPPAGEEGFLYQNTTYVPLRFMANALEKEVRWDNATSTVYVDEPTEQRLIVIRELNMNSVIKDKGLGAGGASTAGKAQWKSLHMYIKPITYVFDGIQKAPVSGQSGMIYNNKIYVPLRFVSESVGRKIDWNPKTFSIQVNSSGTVGKQPAETGDGAPSDETTDMQPGTGNGGVIVFPGGGGGSSAPTYESLVAAAEGSISGLKDRCQSELSPLAEQFLTAKTLDEQLAIYAQGQQKLTECDNSFNEILKQLEAELTKYKYSTKIIAQYRSEYKKMKDTEIQKLLDRLK